MGGSMRASNFGRTADYVARAQEELLRSFEACRIPNFLGSASAGKKVAGTAAY